MNERYWIVCDGDWAIVIADIPVENTVCYCVKSHYNCRWQGYVDSVGRYDQGGRSGSMSRECMSWWEVGYDQARKGQEFGVSGSAVGWLQRQMYWRDADQAVEWMWRVVEYE